MSASNTSRAPSPRGRLPSWRAQTTSVRRGLTANGLAGISKRHTSSTQRGASATFWVSAEEANTGPWQLAWAMSSLTVGTRAATGWPQPDVASSVAEHRPAISARRGDMPS